MVQYLFIVSHMRSRSTLLSHLLANNPHVAGYAETNLPYRTRWDTTKLRIRVFKQTRGKRQRRFVLDRILHNVEMSRAMLARPNVRCIYLLRKPEETLKSIIQLADLTGITNYRDPQFALRHYLTRMAAMRLGAVQEPSSGFFIDSERLVRSSEQVLRDLTDWLDLPVPLQTQYRLWPKTGFARAGDPSAFIRAGEIVETPPHTGIELPTALLHQASQAYDETRRELRKLLKGG